MEPTAGTPERLTPPQDAQPSHPRPPVTPARSRPPVGSWLGAGLIGALLASGGGWLLRPDPPSGSGEGRSNDLGTLAQSTTAPWAIPPLDTPHPLPGGAPQAGKASANGAPLIALGDRQTDADSQGLAPNAPTAVVEHEHRPQAEESLPVVERPPARLAQQTPAKAKSTPSSKRKAAKSSRKKVRSKSAKRTRKAPSGSFWASRQGGFFLRD